MYSGHVQYLMLLPHNDGQSAHVLYCTLLRGTVFQTCLTHMDRQSVLTSKATWAFAGLLTAVLKVW